jgi:hypothetical protein
MSSNVELHLIAYDEASMVVEQVGSNFNVTMMDIEGNVQNVTAQTEEASASFRDSMMSMNMLAMSGMNLVMSFERVQNSQVMLDRANVMVERSTLALQRAQDAYNRAVQEYGATSPEAQAALEKLQYAQDAHNVSLERAGMAQRNLTNSMLFAAMSVIPSLIGVTNLVSNATEIWEGIQIALNAVMDANPIFLVITAVAALAAGIVYLYNTCAPVRDAINAIGNALKFVGEVIAGGVLAWVKAVYTVFSDIAGAIGGFIGWITGAGRASENTAAKTEKLTEATKEQTVAFDEAYIAAQKQAEAIKQIQVYDDALRSQFAKTGDDVAKEFGRLEEQYGLLQATAASDLPMIAKYFQQAFNKGDLHDAAVAVKSFAEEYSISLSDAEKILSDWKDAQAEVPKTLEEQLVGKAQADMDSFKNCMTDKMSSLSGEGAFHMQTLAGDVTNLIKHGLVGEAQNAMKEYVDCSTSKVSDMVLSIQDDMKNLTADQNRKLTEMKDLAETLTGAEKDAVLAQIDAMTKQYNEKMTQLRDWQARLLSQMQTNTDNAFSNMTNSVLTHARDLNRELVELSIWTDMLENMRKQAEDKLGKVEKRFSAMGEAVQKAVPGTVGAPGFGIPETPARMPVVLHITAPLINIEGNADKATVDLAARQVLSQLKTVIVEPTSTSAAATQKRIRKGAVFG